MTSILEAGLLRLGFCKTTSKVAGYDKDFWFKDGYWFASRGISKYGIVRDGVRIETPNGNFAREKLFTSRKRNPDYVDSEILTQLEKWLENPEF